MQAVTPRQAIAPRQAMTQRMPSGQPKRQNGPHFGNDDNAARPEGPAEADAAAGQFNDVRDQFRREANEKLAEIKKKDLVVGFQNFAGVLAKGIGLNGGLKQANPNSTFSDRVWAIFHLAVLAFNEAFDKPRATDVARYFDILEGFPKLALKNTLGEDFSITGKILDQLDEAKAADVKSKLAQLAAEHDAGSDDLNLAELRADIKAIRTLV